MPCTLMAVSTPAHAFGIPVRAGLHVLAGNNQLKKLDNVMYLRQFKNLRLVNLAGNPFCKDHDYRCESVTHE